MREIVARLCERGVLIGYASDRGFRAVAHSWIDEEDIEGTIAALQAVAES